uniref:Cytochrome b5 reductase 4 n=1 Tax=Xenopus tropicalis TaxID=8364 RepID=A0A5S6KC48_XENTR
MVAWICSKLPRSAIDRFFCETGAKSQRRKVAVACKKVVCVKVVCVNKVGEKFATSAYHAKFSVFFLIAGMVYNITPYMEYHPGGEEELMKAAGRDGTDLFDQVHRWVNYESMLKECLIGRMAIKHVSISKGNIVIKVDTFFLTLSGSVASSKMSRTSSKESHPWYDWFQTESLVTVAVYTKMKNVCSELVIVDHLENVLRGEIIIGDYSYLLHSELSHPVQKDIEVKVSATAGKIEIKMKKKEPVSWKSLGQPMDGHNSFLKHSQRGLYYRKCRLASKTDINYNTKLFCVQLPQGCHLQVPVGHHIYLKMNISGVDIVKPYTPVASCLLPDAQYSTFCNKQCLYLMIKIYPNGSITPHLENLTVGDYISISNPQGTFSSFQIENVMDVFLVAAGTGITPMIRLLQHVLTCVSSLRKAKLIFFNKKEEDILWKEQVEELSLADKRFEAQLILSEPSVKWTGYRGQISYSLLNESILRTEEGSKILICICGPNAFVDQGISFLQDLGFSKEEVFAFRE